MTAEDLLDPLIGPGLKGFPHDHLHRGAARTTEAPQVGQRVGLEILAPPYHLRHVALDADGR